MRTITIAFPESELHALRNYLEDRLPSSGAPGPTLQTLDLQAAFDRIEDAVRPAFPAPELAFTG